MKSAEQSLMVTCRVRFDRGVKGKLEMRRGEAIAPSAPVGRVPRIARLVALAIRFDELLKRGEVKDYAELARIGHVTRARVTQIMNLLNLAPELQEELLFLPRVASGNDILRERDVRPLAAQVSWAAQRAQWKH